MPDKHISLSESIIGLGCLVLEILTSKKNIDEIHIEIIKQYRKGVISSYHSYENTVLAVVFLYSIGIVDKDNLGCIYKCD